MKKIYIFLIGTLFLFGAGKTYAQQIGNLDGIYYQAVAIDEDGKEIVGMDIEGKPLYNKEIGVRFTITKGLDGDIQWEETHTTTTDEYGLFTLIIGQGTPTGNAAHGSLLDIPWIEADQFLKVEISTKNDGNYKPVNNQKFMTVPYAFYTDDIADNAITTHKILDGEVLNQDIADNAVTTDKILDGEILNEDIADATIDLTQKVTEILGVENGGTGVDGSTAGDGQLLIGDNTTGDYKLANLTPGTGINITNQAGGIIIESTITGGVNSNANASVNPGNIPAGDYWLSPAFVLDQPADLDPIAMGDILIASTDVNMQGCLMNVYLTDVNNGVAHARVTIFNPSGTAVNLGNGVNVKILVVK